MNSKADELHDRQTAEMGDFLVIIIAFCDRDFDAGLKRNGISSSDELISLDGGVFVRKKDWPQFIQMLKRHKKEIQRLAQLNADVTANV